MRARASWAGSALGWADRSDLAHSIFFSSVISIYNFPRSANFNNSQKINTSPFCVIRISMSSLGHYLSDGTSPLSVELMFVKW
jgi:hypothetical protein